MGSSAIKSNLWIGAVVLGMMFVGIGIYMVSEAFTAKDLVRDTLVAEQITTSSGASIPGVLVQDVETALSQEGIIKEHTLGQYGPYSGMERGDPNRATYIDGVALRTALSLSVMGFRVSDLVAGVGALVIVIGLSEVFLLAPAMYWMGKPTSTNV